jgi:hypothetical protein
MAKEQQPHGSGDGCQLSLLIYELRDDLAEFLCELESGKMTREQVVAAAKVELEQVLKALSDDKGPEGSVCLL